MKNILFLVKSKKKYVRMMIITSRSMEKPHFFKKEKEIRFKPINIICRGDRGFPEMGFICMGCWGFALLI